MRKKSQFKKYAYNVSIKKVSVRCTHTAHTHGLHLVNGTRVSVVIFGMEWMEVHHNHSNDSSGSKPEKSCGNECDKCVFRLETNDALFPKLKIQD